MNTQISIGQIGRGISELVNRVAYAGERIILTSRGKPKAALISMADYERLTQIDRKPSDIQVWLTQTQKISDNIRNRRGEMIDVDALLNESRSDLEAR
ncbi:MAG: type II toxin-antitoxin system prevent-host-death family antitoxin [Anaerolineales bacterium]